MSYSDNEMCTILLSSYIGVNDSLEAKPLSLGEWNKFIEVCIANKLEPSIVYTDRIQELKQFGYDDAFIERAKKLVGRGASVGFELEEYEKRGIHVITFIDKQYPIMLKRELKNKKPPVLFYAGDITLANKVGIGVVGSRNISDAGVAFTEHLVKKAVEEHLIIYSGGAKGVDNISQSVALNHGGAVVAYIADSLSAVIKKAEIAKQVAAGKLLLISDSKPDLGFSAGRAMTRNKYIYASAKATFVVESDYNKGGTWTGATEAMKNQWGKVLVWNKEAEGNRKLIENGGISYEISDEKLMEVMERQPDVKAGKNGTSQEESFEQMSLLQMLGQ